MNALVSDQMKAKGFVTDAALAQRVGFERSMITKIRRGQAKPSLEQALKLSEALDLPPGAFLPPPKKPPRPSKPRKAAEQVA